MNIKIKGVPSKITQTIQHNKLASVFFIKIIFSSSFFLFYFSHGKKCVQSVQKNVFFDG
jgi:hypothetical protein